MPVDVRDLRTREILARVEIGEAISQRAISRELGIALGLTNQLLRQMARRGWVRLRREKANRVRYAITPAGLAEKARITRAHLGQTLQLYADARRRIGERFDALSHEPEPQPDGASDDRQIAFFGSGALAEIAYICVSERDLTLMGVVDDDRAAPFFGVPVYRVDQLAGTCLGGQPFWRLIVMSFDESPSVQRLLEQRRVPRACVRWM